MPWLGRLRRVASWDWLICNARLSKEEVSSALALCSVQSTVRVLFCATSSASSSAFDLGFGFDFCWGAIVKTSTLMSTSNLALVERQILRFQNLVTFAHARSGLIDCQTRLHWVESGLRASISEAGHLMFKTSDVRCGTLTIEYLILMFDAESNSNVKYLVLMLNAE